MSRPVRAAAAAGRQLQGRGHADRLQELLADRHPARGRPQRPHRRHDRARQRHGSRVGRRRRAARRNQHGVALAHRRPERSAEPAAGQPRPLLASEPTGGVTSNENSNSLGGPEQLTTINGSQNAQIGIGQLPARWRQQHRRPARHRQPRAESRSGAGVPRHHQQLRRRVRPLPGRRRRRRHQVGHQPVPRRARSSSSATRSLNAKRWAPPGDAGHEGSARSEPVRRRVRRTAQARTRRSSSPATPACGRKRPTTATPRSCRPRSSAPATSRSRRSSRAIR